MADGQTRPQEADYQEACDADASANAGFCPGAEVRRVALFLLVIGAGEAESEDSVGQEC